MHIWLKIPKTLIVYIPRSRNRLGLGPQPIESQLSWLSIGLANAVAAGDLGFEVTFFYVTSANLAPKSCFLGYFWIFVNFAVLSNFRKMAISRDLGRVRRRA